MKITLMIRSLTLGGAERQLVGLAVMLSDSGHEVEVLTYHEGDFYAPMLDNSGVRHVLIPKTGGSRSLERRIAAHFQETRPDTVIAFLTGPSVKACHVKRRWPHFRLIVSERNVNTWTGPHDLWRFLTFRRADMVVANSHAQESYIRRRFPFLGGKLSCIVNFTDHDTFRPSASRTAGDPPLIVTAARVDRRKNVHGYIRALSILRSKGIRFRAEWYGLKEDDAYSRRCLELAEKLGVRDCFSLLPATSSIADVYRRADYFCLPSFYEGTPNALCEAISCGLPAVASRISDNADYAVDGMNGFTCDPSAPGDIAAALEKMLGLDAAAASEASVRISGKLSPKRFISEWSAIL